MAPRPEHRRSARRVLAALSALAAVASAGCGKSNLTEDSTSAKTSATTAQSTSSVPSTSPAGPGRPGPGGPAHAPSKARSAAFARAVVLTAADVPGSRASPRTSPSKAREREATTCGGSKTLAIAEARSPEFERGRGIERESLSSSVEVLGTSKKVERDLSGTGTAAGLRCYERVLRRSLEHETDPNVRLLGIRVAPLHVTIAGAGVANGIRIQARVGVPSASAVVPLYVDALTTRYGPAEIDLFATSFVQPVAARTEQELLKLLHDRAIRERL